VYKSLSFCCCCWCCCTNWMRLDEFQSLLIIFSFLLSLSLSHTHTLSLSHSLVLVYDDRRETADEWFRLTRIYNKRHGNFYQHDYAIKHLSRLLNRHTRRWFLARSLLSMIALCQRKTDEDICQRLNKLLIVILLKIMMIVRVNIKQIANGNQWWAIELHVEHQLFTWNIFMVDLCWQ
jgi:hypothetical protein